MVLEDARNVVMHELVVTNSRCSWEHKTRTTEDTRLQFIYRTNQYYMELVNK